MDGELPWRQGEAAGPRGSCAPGACRGARLSPAKQKESLQPLHLSCRITPNPSFPLAHHHTYRLILISLA